MLHPGDEIELRIERPAAGGRMIARHEGFVLLVHGGIPGERVVSRVERLERRLGFAETQRVLEPSPDRRIIAGDPRCGGCAYAHIAYPRQLALKADVIRDAFLRLGRIPLDGDVSVLPSPEAGYRMRARLHVRAGEVGFYREGTHEICDPVQTRQLAGSSLVAVRTALRMLAEAGVEPRILEISENMAGDERAVHVEASGGGRAWQAALDRAVRDAGLTGGSLLGSAGVPIAAGAPAVADPLPALTSGRAAGGHLRRRPQSFFQGNRFLLPSLVEAVMDAVPESGPVLDLYAGVGLFAVALAAGGRARITAVEGDRSAGEDLRANARPFKDAVHAVLGGVEEHLARAGRRDREIIIVDPPRSGMSRTAMERIVERRAARVVYVSCDPATMARDARRLIDAGYRLALLRAFDLFPNTPHVETLGVFD